MSDETFSAPNLAIYLIPPFMNIFYLNIYYNIGKPQESSVVYTQKLSFEREKYDWITKINLSFENPS